MRRLLWALAAALVAHLLLLQLRLPESDTPELALTGSGRVSVRLAAAPVPIEEGSKKEPEVEPTPEPESEPPEPVEQVTVESPGAVEVPTEPGEAVTTREEAVQVIEPQAEKVEPKPRKRKTPPGETTQSGQVAAVQADAAEGAMYQETQALQPAQPLAVVNKPPRYPPLARRRGWEGTVLLEVEVAGDGRVRTIRVARSSSYSLLDREAVRAVRTWRFTPGSQNGVPVASTVRVPVHFMLEDN